MLIDTFGFHICQLYLTLFVNNLVYVSCLEAANSSGTFKYGVLEEPIWFISSGGLMHYRLHKITHSLYQPIGLGEIIMCQWNEKSLLMAYGLFFFGCRPLVDH